MDALTRQVMIGDGTEIANTLVSDENDAAIAVALYDNEDISGRFRVRSVQGSTGYSFEVNGKLVDFSSKLNPQELKLADNMNIAFNDCKKAVFNLYEHFNGDFQRFSESDICALLLHQRISTTLDTYDPKLIEHGLSATELMGLTAKKIQAKYQGQDEKTSILSKVRATMVMQVNRLKSTFIPFLQGNWVKRKK